MQEKTGEGAPRDHNPTWGGTSVTKAVSRHPEFTQANLKNIPITSALQGAISAEEHSVLVIARINKIYRDNRIHAGS
jgi:hypothetical protein